MHLEREFTIMEPYSSPYANVYGHLWTPTSICARWTFFFIFLYVFYYYSHPKDITTSPHHQHNMRDFYHHHSIMYDTNPLYSPKFLLHLLLFVRTFPLSLLV